MKERPLQPATTAGEESGQGDDEEEFDHDGGELGVAGLAWQACELGGGGGGVTAEARRSRRDAELPGRWRGNHEGRQAHEELGRWWRGPTSSTALVAVIVHRFRIGEGASLRFARPGGEKGG